MSDTIKVMKSAADEIWCHLFPRWIDIRQENKDGARIKIPSSYLCRESSVFAARALEEAGFDGWEDCAGSIDLSGKTNVPRHFFLDFFGDLREDCETADHAWLVNDSEGLLLDVTADQFGHIDGAVVMPLERARDYLPSDERIDLMQLPEVAKTVEKWERDPHRALLIDHLVEFKAQLASGVTP